MAFFFTFVQISQLKTKLEQFPLKKKQQLKQNIKNLNKKIIHLETRKLKLINKKNEQLKFHEEIKLKLKHKVDALNVNLKKKKNEENEIQQNIKQNEIEINQFEEVMKKVAKKVIN